MIGLYSANSQSALGFTGLLDEYGGAAAAYSVRRLSSSYSGSLIEVRRSSDNTTQNIGYDANGDLDTAALLEFVGAGDGFVRTWYDQSGNTNNATQTTTSNQPQIVSSGSVITTNSKSILNFATNKFLDTGLDSQFSNDITAALVRDIVTYPNTYNSAFNHKQFGITYNSAGGTNYSNGAHVFYNRLTGGADTYPTTIGQGLDFFYNRNLLAKNGTSYTLNRFLSYGGGTGTIGGWNASTQSFNNKIQEIVIWESDQRSNQAGIENNINDYFSIY